MRDGSYDGAPYTRTPNENHILHKAKVSLPSDIPLQHLQAQRFYLSAGLHVRQFFIDRPHPIATKALLGIWLGWRAICQIAPASPFLPAGLVADPIHCSVTGWLGWLFVIHSSHLCHFQNFWWQIFLYNI